jgi:deoxyhypusine synthase
MYKPGAAAEYGAGYKIQKYAEALTDGEIFVPFIVETGGRLAQCTVDWLDEHWKSKINADERERMKQKIQRVYLAVERQRFFSNANMFYKFGQDMLREAADVRVQ